MRLSQRVSKYILIVILPLIILTIIYWFYFEQSIQNEQQEQAKWIGSVYQMHLDQVIRENKEKIELLSTSYLIQYKDEKSSNKMVHAFKESDPRYADIYLLNPDGMVVSGTSEQTTHSNLIEQKDMEIALKTQKATIIRTKKLENSNCKCFTILSPILKNDKKVQGFILAQVKFDYLVSVINKLSSERTVQLQTGSNLMVMDIEEHSPNSEWVKTPLSEVDWSLSVKIPNKSNTLTMNTFYSFIFFTFIITHVIFIVVYELIIRRESKKQKQLIDDQKLNFVGTLAASTAHEIKNPLTGIKGLVQLLNEKHPDEQDQFYYSVILKEIERINSIVSEFLILGKPLVQNLASYDIRGIVAELRPIIESEARYYNIDVEWKIVRSPLRVNCSKDQLKQVILNIAKNGFEAMEQGKKLTIHIHQKNQEAVIELIDRGHGMDANNISKVFEPFYTSKKKGTGLGLFVCKRIIDLFNGTIELTSKPSQGTTVIIRLPILKENELRE